MLDMSLSEMLVIGVLILVFIGPDRIPEMMRFLGRNYAKLRSASDELRRTFNAEVARVDADRRHEEMLKRRAKIQRERDAEGVAPPTADVPTADEGKS